MRKLCCFCPEYENDSELKEAFKYIVNNESQIKNTLNDIIPKYKKKAGIAVGELRNLK